MRILFSLAKESVKLALNEYHFYLFELQTEERGRNEIGL
jgi:hypothetical protein